MTPTIAGMKATTIRLDDALWLALRTKLLREGKSLNQWATEQVIAYLKEES